MFKFFKSFDLFSYLLTSTGEGVLNSIYEGMTLVGPYVLSVVSALCLFYGIFLGVKYVKAEDEAAKANMQKTLVNFIIGAVTVIVLLSILYAIRGPLADFINGGQ